MKGVLLALGSVVLVSMAQLLLRHAMLLLAPLTAYRLFISELLHGAPGSGALLLGIVAYIASMGVWYLALQRMALSKAYALLSLSYILVWAAAIMLPGWDEYFSWRDLAGVGFIIAGILVIFRPARRADISARPGRE